MSSSKPPKPSKEQNDLALAQAQAMRDQTAFAREQWGVMRPIIEQQNALGLQEAEFQRALAEEAAARARKYDQRYWDTTARQEDEFYKLVDQYATDAEAQRMAGRGIADVESQLALARDAGWRAMAARGLTPNSNMMASTMADMDLEGALARASASTMALEAAKREGLNLRAMAAGLGGNVTGAGLGYTGQAGNLSGTSLGAAGTGLQSRISGIGAYNNAQNTAIGWGNGANATFDSIAEQNYRRSQAGGGFGDFLGNVIGTGLGAYAGGWGTAAGKAFGSRF
jgi:hypothetical protein